MTLAAAEDADLANGSAVFDVTSSGLTTVSVTGTEADIDVLTLTFSLNTGSVSENAGVSAATGTVTRNDDDLSSALEVTLDSNDTSAATVPTTVTILAGQTSATFDIAAVDDLVVDGTQTVTFTASAANYVAGTSNLDVTDDDVLTLTVSLNKTSVSETAGKNAATGTVSRNSADLSSALVVTLASNDTSEATVPATVTILAGESSATFTIAAIDDAVIDGTQVVTFTASVTSYESGTSNLNLTDNELSLPVISGPETQVSSLRPVISWTASEGATSYEIWIRNQSTATNPFHTGTSTGTSYTPDVDLGIGKFNLWVRAMGPAGDSPWTAQLNFTINTAATLTAIDRWQSTSRPTISWNSLPGAVKYDIWINDHLAGINPYIRNGNITETSFTPTGDMPIGLYRIWVRGISADGIAAAWSPLSEFYVVPAPVITGGNLPTFDRSPTLDWEAVTGAVSYEVFVRNSTTGATVHYPRNLTETSWTPPADLADGPYRWWVLATGANGVRGQWSAPIDIHVGGRPNVLSPAGTVNSSTPTINWQAVDGAVRYELWVTNMSSMVRVIYDTNLTVNSFTPSSALANGDYRVWVRAVSSTGEFSLWSLAVNFTIAQGNSPKSNILSESHERLVVLESAETPLLDSRLSRPQTPTAEESESATRRISPQDAHDSQGSGVFLTETPHRHFGTEASGAEICLTDLEKLWESAELLLAELNQSGNAVAR